VGRYTVGYPSDSLASCIFDDQTLEIARQNCRFHLTQCVGIYMQSIASD